MLTLRQHPSNGRRVAGKLVGDHHPWLGARLAVKHTTQEALGGYLMAPLLDQDVQNDAVLVNGSPQPVTFATDLQRHFVQMPLVASSPSSSTQPGSEGGAELGAPLPDRLVADDDPAFGKQILDVTKTEMKAKIQPHGVGDDLRRESVAAIRRRVSGLGDGHQARLIADPWV